MNASNTRRQVLQWGAAGPPAALLSLFGSFGLAPQAARAASLVSLIATLKASVLPVGTYNATDNPRFGFRGTGFVVGDGSLIATNFHVLPEVVSLGNTSLAVVAFRTPTEPQGQVRRVRLVASDRVRDLALLQLEGTPLSPLVLDDVPAREGQNIALMGFPIGSALGFAPVTHHGIVSSITTAALPAPTAGQLDPRAVAALRNGNFEIYQLDATAYPGNSGGPLFDAETGRVLGIVNMVLVKGNRESAISSPTGISYAVPVSSLRELMKAPR
jgi:S1-C subfamily serine protease